MRAVIQRVKQASVTIDQSVVGQIASGQLVLLGVEQGDTDKDLEYLVEKSVGLRIFEDEQGKMNRSLVEAQGSMLVVSQFTLLGDTRKGRRPSFIRAADPADGLRYYELFVERIRGKGIKVATGQFGADMQVALVNDGPVTILLDSRKNF